MEKKRSFSLFFYTGLIFVVAVLLIVIAFFGQSRQEKNQPEIDMQAETNTLTQRAAVLSEENKALLEENQQLRDKNTQLNAAVQEKDTQTQQLTQDKHQTELLLSANGYVSKKMYQEAKDVLAQLDTQTLSEDEMILYNTLMKKIR